MGTAIYDQIYQALLESICKGEMAPGARIPSEKELAEEFKVSRITSKNALDKLAREGWIVRRVGLGSFVSDPLPKKDGENVAERIAIDKEPENKSQCKGLIGVIMQDWSPSYGMQLVSGIEAAITKNDMAMVLRRSYGNQRQENQAIEFLLGLDIDGLIIYPVNGENYNPHILRLHLSDFPIVLVDRYLPGVPAAAVYSDNHGGAREAVKHLIELGRKRIALLSPGVSETVSVKDRIEGFCQAHNEAGLPIDQSLWLTTLPTDRPSETTHDDLAEQAIKSFLLQTPDISGIFTVEYELAVKTRKIAVEMGLRVPGDLAIVCFDAPYISEQAEGYFTHVRQDELEMGNQAVALINELIQDHTKHKQIILPTKLVIAPSTVL